MSGPATMEKGEERPQGLAHEELAGLKEVLRGLARGQIVQTLPEGVACVHELTALLAYMKELHEYLASISRGDLSIPLKIKGPLAGALKALQANLRHLTWQTKMIAGGDLSQRVDFMGDFSASFNTMVDNLREARALLVEKNEVLEKLNREMQQDLELAREVQNATMNFLGDLPFLRSAMIFRPYAEVSGDFYDEYIRTSDGSVNFFLGDATGHGVSAALVTMMVKMGLTSLHPELTTDEVLRRLNGMLNPCIPLGLFLTGIYTRITPQGFVTSCNAGHPPMLIVPCNEEQTVVFEQHGMALGIASREYVRYEECSYQMRSGDRIILYTDGVTECFRAKEEYGVERLKSFLKRNKSMDLDVLLHSLVEDVADFCRHERFKDDLTLIGFELK